MRAGKPATTIGTVVPGTVEGDMHDIGRDIVATMLSARGFKVINLGRDVPASAFLEAVGKEKADILGLSALMTTTLPAQERTVRLFREVGEREKYRIVIGVVPPAKNGRMRSGPTVTRPMPQLPWNSVSAWQIPLITSGTMKQGGIMRG